MLELIIPNCGACPVSGGIPFLVSALCVTRGALPIVFVDGFGFGADGKTGGCQYVSVNGLEAECGVAPVWVPPSAVTAHCFASGEVASIEAIVKVGEVKPVCALPVMGVDGEIAI